jgi:hypothetical protein
LKESWSFFDQTSESLGSRGLQKAFPTLSTGLLSEYVGIFEHKKEMGCG